MDPPRHKGARTPRRDLGSVLPSQEDAAAAAALETQKAASKTKANHGFDHVDDRPRARADGGA